MIVLGIDPGTKLCGWALIDCCPIAKPLWKVGGHNDPFDVADWADRWRPDLVVVEKPIALHGGNLANASVLATIFVGGIVSGMLLEKGYECETISPPQVRASMLGVGKRGNQDAMLKQLLERLIVGRPARWNDHMRDAAAAAIVGHRMWVKQHRLEAANG